MNGWSFACTSRIWQDISNLIRGQLAPVHSSTRNCKIWQIALDYSWEQMAIIIGLSAYVEENDTEKKNDQQESQQYDLLGYQISRGDKPKLSELKFRRLLKINSREKLFRFLIQVIRLMEKKVNLMDLLRIVYFWGGNAKKNLAYQYYEKANLED